MAEAFALTDADRKIVQTLIDEYRARPRKSVGGIARDVSLDLEDGLPPEVYVAKVPTGGIPFIGTAAYIIPDTDPEQYGTGTGTGEVGTGDRPQYADCPIYRVLYRYGVPQLEYAGFTKRVHNSLPVTILADTWVIVARDKWGTWWVVQSGQAQDYTGVTDVVYITQHIENTYLGVLSIWDPLDEDWIDSDIEVRVANTGAFYSDTPSVDAGSHLKVGNRYLARYTGRTAGGLYLYECQANTFHFQTLTPVEGVGPPFVTEYPGTVKFEVDERNRLSLTEVAPRYLRLDTWIPYKRNVSTDCGGVEAGTVNGYEVQYNVCTGVGVNVVGDPDDGVVMVALLPAALDQMGAVDLTNGQTLGAGNKRLVTVGSDILTLWISDFTGTGVTANTTLTGPGIIANDNIDGAWGLGISNKTGRAVFWLNGSNVTTLSFSGDGSLGIFYHDVNAGGLDNALAGALTVEKIYYYDNSDQSTTTTTPPAYGGTGSATPPTNGQVPIGDGSGAYAPSSTIDGGTW